MSDTRKYVQNQPAQLYGAGCSIGATTIVLTSFTQIDGTLLTMTNFGTKGYGTLEPGNTVKEEQISFTGITQNVNGTATLTGVSHVLFVDPYTETSGVNLSHVGGVDFVISNTAGFYAGFTNKGDDETITGLWDFPSGLNNPTIGNLTYVAPTGDTQVATKKYVDVTATGTTSYDQQIISGTAGETFSSGDVVYFKASDQRWWRTDADAIATTGGIQLGIAQTAGTAAASFNVLTSGLAKNLTGLVAGSIYYLSGTTGALTTTAGTFGRFVGWAVSSTVLMFNPTDGYALTQQGSEIYAVDSVGTDTYAITLTPAITAYQAGMVLRFKAGTANTGACTLNVNGLGAKDIFVGGGATPTGTITSSSIVEVIYDGTQFNIMSVSDWITVSATAGKVVQRNTTGDVTVNTTPTASTDAASKSYVDSSTGIKISQVSAPIGQISNSNAENTLGSASIPGGTLGTSGTLRVTGYYIVNQSSGGNITYTLRLKYGTTTIASTTLLTATATNTTVLVEGYIYANASASVQRGRISVLGTPNNTGAVATTNFNIGVGTAAEASSGALTLTLTAQASAASGTQDFSNFLVEKII